MSTTDATHQHAIETCRPEDATPVTLDAAAIESTGREQLRELKAELGANGYVPARVTVDACFDADCSFETQSEADRIREYVRAAAFLGAGTVTVSFDAVAADGKVRSALAACAERARREGVALELDGPLAL